MRKQVTISMCVCWVRDLGGLPGFSVCDYGSRSFIELKGATLTTQRMTVHKTALENSSLRITNLLFTTFFGIFLWIVSTRTDIIRSWNDEVLSDALRAL